MRRALRDLTLRTVASIARARPSRAACVIFALVQAMPGRALSSCATPAKKAKAFAALTVSGAGSSVVNGGYAQKDPSQVPQGFAETCVQNRWDPQRTWRSLSDGKRPWYEKCDGSYIYWNRSDKNWWIDGPNGLGLYIAADTGVTPPAKGWQLLRGAEPPAPTVTLGSAKAE